MFSQKTASISYILFFLSALQNVICKDYVWALVRRSLLTDIEVISFFGWATG